MSAADIPPAMHITRGTGLLRPKRATHLDGLAPDQDFGMHANQLSTLVRGVLERVFYVKRDGVFARPPLPVKGVFAGRLEQQARVIDQWMSGSTCVTEREFAELYTGRRRTLNMAAALSLEIRPVTLIDSYVQVFVKAEKTNFSKKPDAVPRIISPTSRRYLVATGRYIKPLEHKLVKAVNALFGEPTIIKGYNADQAGEIVGQKWNKFTNPVAVGLDASRFDQHVSQEALRWEHSRYMSALAHPHELGVLLDWQLRPKCVGYTSEGKIRYRVDGTRTSGCINTGIGNCLLMCSMIHAYMIYAQIDHYSLLNNGDDCVVIMERRDLKRFNPQLSRWFLEMGFNMVVEKPVFEIEEIVFCQTQPVFVGGSYRMVRQICSSINKDVLSIKELDTPSFTRKWLEAVGKGGQSLGSGIPILQQFYSYFVRASESIVIGKTRSRRVIQRRKRSKLDLDPVMETGFSKMGIGMDGKFRKVSDETRVSFWKAFGITPDMQVHIETHYEQQQFVFEHIIKDKPISSVHLFL